MFKKRKTERQTASFNGKVYKAATGESRVPTKSQRCYKINWCGVEKNTLCENLSSARVSERTTIIITDMRITEDTLNKSLAKLAMIAYNMAVLSDNDAYITMHDTLMKIIDDGTKYPIHFSELSYERVSHDIDTKYIRDKDEPSWDSCVALDKIFEFVDYDWNNNTHSFEVYELYTSLDRLVDNHIDYTKCTNNYKHDKYMHVGSRKMNVHGSDDGDNMKIHTTFCV